MNREKAITLIRGAEKALRAMGASALYLFGSTARNEATPQSDIDIFIDRDPDKPVGLIELTNIEFLLEDTLGTNVDLCTRTALHPALRSSIEETAIRVF